MANETSHRAGEEEKLRGEGGGTRTDHRRSGAEDEARHRPLAQGRGPLLDDVEDCLAELRERGEIALTAQPVVVVVAERRRAGAVMPVLLPPGLPFILPTAGSREDDDDDEDDEDDDERRRRRGRRRIAAKPVASHECILVLYYSQSGDVGKVVETFAAPLRRPGLEVVCHRITPCASIRIRGARCRGCSASFPSASSVPTIRSSRCRSSRASVSIWSFSVIKCGTWRRRCRSRRSFVPSRRPCCATRPSSRSASAAICGSRRRNG